MPTTMRLLPSVPAPSAPLQLLPPAFTSIPASFSALINAGNVSLETLLTRSICFC